jgi:hypothetical protein
MPSMVSFAREQWTIGWAHDGRFDSGEVLRLNGALKFGLEDAKRPEEVPGFRGSCGTEIMRVGRVSSRAVAM